MVCDRCIMAVKFELIKFGIVPIYISLGEIELENELTEFQHQQLTIIFQLYGFEILDKKHTQIIKTIKDLIVEFIHTSDNKINYSVEIEKKTEIKYAYLNDLFSEVIGMTIEHFITTQKVEKAKGLLEYNDRKLIEVSNKLGYKSVAYLSNQFKKITGCTPNYFKNIKNKKKIAFATVEAHKEYDISIIDKSNARTVTKIKDIVIELIHGLNETKKINFPEFIERKLKVEYKYLNKLFSEIEEITIEQYIIIQKTEKAKELIVYKECSLSELSKILGYCSIADVSTQLKTLTGLTAHHFENIKFKRKLMQKQIKPAINIKRIRKSFRVKM
jgi:AraC-like DNA-binding protein